MMKFKNGSFKMAHKAGAPVIPISIINSHKVMPTGWMFAMKPSHGTAKVVVHEPIESVGKTEAELAEAVRNSMITGLGDDQKPL
jgi:1-acyl-sn-glycerol-3-phosphate acyltransferase